MNFREQLFLFVFTDDDAGIFLDSRGVPPSSRSVSSTDDSLRGTSRSTPSDIVYQCLWAAGSFRRCPLPSQPNWTSSAVACGQPAVSVGAPCRPRRTGHYRRHPPSLVGSRQFPSVPLPVLSSSAGTEVN